MISSNTRKKHIIQPINMNQGRKMHMVAVNPENQGNRQTHNAGNRVVGNNAGKNGTRIVRNPQGNVAPPVIGNNSNGHDVNQIRCFNYMGVGHYARNFPIEAQDRAFEEYWNSNGPENGDWKWEELSTFLFGGTLKMISSHFVNPICEDEDSMYWGGSTIGKFSVKSAINFIRNEGDVQHDKKWDLVWKPRCLNASEYLFGWPFTIVFSRMFNELQEDYKTIYLVDPRCTRCGADEESLDHILRRCPFSFITWNKLSYHPPNSSFWTLPLCEWIMENLETRCFLSLYGGCRSGGISIFLEVMRKYQLIRLISYIQSKRDVWCYRKRQVEETEYGQGNSGEAGRSEFLRDAQRYFIRAFAVNYGICVMTRDIMYLNSNPMLRLVKKLKLFKEGIRTWIKDKNDKSKNLKKDLKKKLADIDLSLDKGDASSDSLKERMSIMSKLTDLENLDSLALAQKAKIKWSIEGDENSKYFHGIINKQRNNLAIRGILVDGAWIEDPKIVKDEFFTHFKDRFSNTCSDRLTLDMEFPNKLSIDQKTDLERPFTKEEIKGAVWDCGLNKSSGPDGFTFGFYQRYWSLLEPDIVDAVNHFFTNGCCTKGCNSSFIALIPKTHDAKQVKDFRTISLIGSLYKIIAKLLANRLVILMGDLVNEVDFEKAFDFVRWDFLDDVLKKFGFGDRWCDLIQSCLRSSRGSILVNGSPTSKFQFHKVNAGMFKGVTLHNSLRLSHLFYADDVVFLGKWCDSNLKTIIRVFCFFRASGLRINLHKSKIMGIVVENSKVDIVAADIGCMTLKSPFTYLGVKVGGRMRCTNSWEEIIHKILSRLSKWKMKTLSIGGRLTLLKSVLGVDLKDRKISLIKWDNVLASKEKGGLGVSSFYAVIKAIHGVDGKIGCPPTASFSSNWIDIVRETFTLRDKGMDLLGLIKKKSRQWRMPRGGIEQDQMADLYLKMKDIILPNMMDRWFWSLSGSGEFSVASVRNFIDDHTLVDSAPKTRWIKAVLKKINIHAWRVKLDNLPMRFNLSRRGIDLDYIYCPI
ncbi:RNA-directed DNA polymerase, eukaryota [Tanacetum coccineum]|uniref:RNA-directed DNA polymerase, eukaryota n=1 Tax=Tanacetum coccineum TaxID=301880 RepID=A0ABQ4XGU3_9ASTR